MCRSHAVRAAVQIVGATVEDLDDDARVVIAGLEARDRETAAMRARDHEQETAELQGRVAPLSPERRDEIRDFHSGLHAVWRLNGGKPPTPRR